MYLVLLEVYSFRGVTWRCTWRYVSGGMYLAVCIWRHVYTLARKLVRFFVGRPRVLWIGRNGFKLHGYFWYTRGVF